MTTENKTGYNRFTDFAANSAKFIVGLAAISPVLADYLGLINIEQIFGKETSKIFATSTSLIIAAVMLSIFYIRQEINRPVFLLYGTLLVALGCIQLLYISHGYYGREDGAKIFFMVAFTACASGAELILLYGYTREGQREAFLLDAAPELDQREWRQVESLTQSMLTIRKRAENLRIEGKKARGEAIARSASAVEEAMFKRINLVAEGIFEVRGDKMISVFETFAAAIHYHFKAVSYQDFSYWASPKSNKYLSINKKIVERGVPVQRLFIVKEEFSLTAEDLAGIIQNIELGVKVAFVLEASLDLSELVRGCSTDFALFDDFALSTWDRHDGRLFRLSVNDEGVKNHIKQLGMLESFALQDPHMGEEKYFSKKEIFLESQVWNKLKKKYDPPGGSIEPIVVTTIRREPLNIAVVMTNQSEP